MIRNPGARGAKQLGWVREKLLRLLGPFTVPPKVDLLARTRATLVERGVVYRRDAVAIGSPETPTPTGDFYVTDKLPGPRFGTYYGCCILALSGRQPNLPKERLVPQERISTERPHIRFPTSRLNSCAELYRTKRSHETLTKDRRAENKIHA